MSTNNGENPITPPQPTWPPPPDIPDPWAKHESFLTAIVRAPASRPPLSRLRLVRELRRATGLDLRECLAIVNGFCDHHGIFPRRRGLRLWLPVLPSLLQIVVSAALFVSQIVLGREMTAARTWAARYLIRQERVTWDGIFLLLIFVIVIANFSMAAVTTRDARRQAEDARRKLTE